jgi:hypothetical protein
MPLILSKNPSLPRRASCRRLQLASALTLPSMLAAGVIQQRADRPRADRMAVDGHNRRHGVRRSPTQAPSADRHHHHNVALALVSRRVMSRGVRLLTAASTPRRRVFPRACGCGWCPTSWHSTVTGKSFLEGLLDTAAVVHAERSPGMTPRQMTTPALVPCPYLSALRSTTHIDTR